MTPAGEKRLWGLMAEFAGADELLAAALAAREAGFSRVAAYSPFPIEGLAEAIGFEPRRVPLATFLGALLGGAGGYFMQWYSAVVDYPIAVGGRPLHSWPMFVPVTFETAVLGGALAAFLAVILGNRLPDLAHPVFDVPDFDLATRNRFFLCLRAEDERFDAAEAARWLGRREPLRQQEVWW